MSCCVCRGRCKCTGPHRYCSQHYAAAGPFFCGPRRFSLEEWILLGLSIAMVAIAASLCGSCAARAPHPQPVIAASQPASAPASQPTCVPRETFNRLADMYVGLWRDKGEALADCTENAQLMKDDRDAESARANEAEAKLTLVGIIGPTAAAVVTGVVTWVVTHFAQAKH